MWPSSTARQRGPSPFPGGGPLPSFADRWHPGLVFEHLIELPGRTVVYESPLPHAPPLLITVDGVRYIAVPVMTTVQAQRPWRYVALD